MTDPKTITNDAFQGLLVEAEDGAVITEHFRCHCGHEWSRELYDGLFSVGCPNCRTEHLTQLGQFMCRLLRHAESLDIQ
jgi:hypothetical protein